MHKLVYTLFVVIPSYALVIKGFPNTHITLNIVYLCMRKEVLYPKYSINPKNMYRCKIIFKETAENIKESTLA